MTDKRKTTELPVCQKIMYIALRNFSREFMMIVTKTIRPLIIIISGESSHFLSNRATKGKYTIYDLQPSFS